MKASEKGLKVIQGSSGQDADRIPTSRLKIIAAAVGLAALLIGGARWSPQLDANRANDAAIQAGSTSFVYFPAQYENQAREKEEHIQAF